MRDTQVAQSGLTTTRTTYPTENLEMKFDMLVLAPEPQKLLGMQRLALLKFPMARLRLHGTHSL